MRVIPHDGGDAFSAEFLVYRDFAYPAIAVGLAPLQGYTIAGISCPKRAICSALSALYTHVQWLPLQK